METVNCISQRLTVWTQPFQNRKIHTPFFLYDEDRKGKPFHPAWHPPAISAGAKGVCIMLKAAAVILLSLAVLKKGGSLVLKVILALLCLSVFLFVGQVLFFVAALVLGLNVVLRLAR